MCVVQISFRFLGKKMFLWDFQANNFGVQNVKKKTRQGNWKEKISGVLSSDY
jgi:hypothetical protein